MKRFVSSFIMLLSCICVFSQMAISEKELECYIDRDTMSWTKKARDLSLEYALNDEGELKLTEICEFKGQSKSELYNKILDWILSVSTGTDSAVQIADEEKGRIVTNSCLSYVYRGRRPYSYYTSIKPLLQFDFKDGKVRFIYTLQSFDVLEMKKRSEQVMFVGNNTETQEMASILDKKSYLFKNSYPFVEDSKVRRRLFADSGVKSDATTLSISSKVSSCMYVNSIAFYHWIIDKTTEVLSKETVKHDDIDNNDNW